MQDIYSIEELKTLLDTLRKDFKEKTENQELLERVISLYNEYILGKNPFSGPEASFYFLHKFTSDLIQSVMSLSSLTKYEVTIQLTTFSIKMEY